MGTHQITRAAGMLWCYLEVSPSQRRLALGSPHKQGGEERLGKGSVSCSCQQPTGLPDYRGPGLASGSQGSPVHLRETSSDGKRSNHQLLTYLPEPDGAPLFHLSGGPHRLLVSPVGSLDWPLSFTRSKMTLLLRGRILLLTPRDWQGQDAPMLPLGGQEDSTTGETVGNTAVAPSTDPHHPQAPGAAERPARGSRQMCVSLSL